MKDVFYLQLLHCKRAGMEWHEDLENVCQQAGLKGKKLSKVKTKRHQATTFVNWTV
jgi:hypothetical protein